MSTHSASTAAPPSSSLSHRRVPATHEQQTNIHRESDNPSQNAMQRIQELESKLVELEALAKSGSAPYSKSAAPHSKSSPTINLPAAPSPSQSTGVSAMGLGNRDDDNATYHRPLAPADLSVSVLRAVTGKSIGMPASSYQQSRVYPMDVVYSIDLFKLPPRAEANRMLSTYERETWPLYVSQLCQSM